jgi:hypothetical protein
VFPEAILLIVCVPRNDELIEFTYAVPGKNTTGEAVELNSLEPIPVLKDDRVAYVAKLAYAKLLDENALRVVLFHKLLKSVFNGAEPEVIVYA